MKWARTVADELRGVELGGDFRGARLLADDQEGVVSLHHFFEVGNLMPGQDGKVRGNAAHALVLGHGHLNRLRAGFGRTLAKELGGVLARDVADPLVDLAEDRLVLAGPFGPGIHALGILRALVVGLKKKSPSFYPPLGFSPQSRGDEGRVDRDTRREEYEKMFRHGNESLHDAAVDAGKMSRVPYLCECADVECSRPRRTHPQ